MTRYRILLIIAILFIFISGSIFAFYLVQRSTIQNKIQTSDTTKEGRVSDDKNKSMILQSPAFEDSGHIPEKYTCDGDNINPPLKIISVPEHSESLVLIVEDPDAPIGTFIHWVLYNIDPKTTSIEEGVAPAGALEGRNDFGETRYGGPCPPSGTHRYFFRLYALDKKLELPPGASKEEVEQMMGSHIIAQTELLGLYSRQFR